MRSALALLHRAALGIASWARNIYYRALGADIQGYCWLRRISIPRNWPDVTLERNVALDDGVERGTEPHQTAADPESVELKGQGAIPVAFAHAPAPVRTSEGAETGEGI